MGKKEEGRKKRTKEGEGGEKKKKDTSFGITVILLSDRFNLSSQLK